MSNEHEHDGPMPEIRDVARATAAAKASYNMAEFSRLLAEYRRLLIENPDTTTESECYCGCIENDDIFKMLRDIGLFPAELYTIAFETGHLSKKIEDGSTKKKVQNTTEMVSFGFCYMTYDFKKLYDRTLIIPVEEAQENIMKTIDVFYTNFKENSEKNYQRPNIP